MQPLLECVPNFSEGRDAAIIRAIAAEVEQSDGVKLLDVDPGASTNRTVVTFAGAPEAVVEAAFRAIRRAAELIDMRKHKGAHPRMGATDVCPLIPISGISMEEALEWAHKLALRVGESLSIPVYLYEYAASAPHRRNLADIRAGEYEGFEKKILLPEWRPDYGPRVFNAKAGQTVIGVRDFLVAYNINLNTHSERRANSVAFDIREKGRVKTADGTPNGKAQLDENGEAIRVPGACKHVKAIGWYIGEYGIAQVSCNLTNIRETPVHQVFEAARKSADSRGLRVTGSELVGLIPLHCLLDAGRFYLAQQGLSEGVSDETLIHIAVKSLGLDELGPFDPQKKIIEYRLAADQKPGLTALTLREFANQLASDSPAPGGGSVAALCGALAASLAAMVANVSATRRGWETRIAEFSSIAVEGQQLKTRLLNLVQTDTDAFNAVLEAYRLPKGSEEEKAARQAAIEAANQHAAVVPLQIARTAAQCFDLLEAMARDGNPNAVTDAGVGVLCAHSAVQGAVFNVRINLGSIRDEVFKERIAAEAAELSESADIRRTAILSVVESKIGV